MAATGTHTTKTTPAHGNNQHDEFYVTHTRGIRTKHDCAGLEEGKSNHGVIHYHFDQC